ncbi:MAG: hypothetical protein Q4G25_13885 [Paracoccus sp. (in: a-proteobacteria)]|nr:hypothetical protein [Paracoccus sp. (in: a-proteobacteria)]
MRKLAIVVIGALVVAGCGNGTGKISDPRYPMNGETPYGQYRIAREAALTGAGPEPRIIPRAEPFTAPTASEIAGPGALDILAQKTRLDRAGAAGTAPTTGAGRGGYVDPDSGRRATTAAVVPARPVTAAAASGQTDALTRYAFAQGHAPGTAVHARSGGSASEAARACARFPNAAAAQLMFLSAGGPGADPYGMDPDGDGFVCGWDPAPYRVEQL